MRPINMWSLIVVALAAVALVVFVTTTSVVASPSYGYEASPFHGSADIEVHIPQRLIAKVTVEEKRVESSLSLFKATGKLTIFDETKKKLVHSKAKAKDANPAVAINFVRAKLQAAIDASALTSSEKITAGAELDFASNAIIRALPPGSITFP